MTKVRLSTIFSGNSAYEEDDADVVGPCILKDGTRVASLRYSRATLSRIQYFPLSKFSEQSRENAKYLSLSAREDAYELYDSAYWEGQDRSDDAKSRLRKARMATDSGVIAEKMGKVMEATFGSEDFSKLSREAVAAHMQGIGELTKYNTKYFQAHKGDLEEWNKRRLVAKVMEQVALERGERVYKGPWQEHVARLAFSFVSTSELQRLHKNGLSLSEKIQDLGAREREILRDKYGIRVMHRTSPAAKVWRRRKAHGVKSLSVAQTSSGSCRYIHSGSFGAKVSVFHSNAGGFSYASPGAPSNPLTLKVSKANGRGMRQELVSGRMESSTDVVSRVRGNTYIQKNSSCEAQELQSAKEACNARNSIHIAVVLAEAKNVPGKGKAENTK